MKTCGLLILLAIPLGAQAPAPVPIQRDPFALSPEDIRRRDERLVKSYQKEIEEDGLFGTIARLRLGVAYMEGKGVEKNPFAGIRLIREAAMLGVFEAAIQMGVYCANGQGVPKDYAEAYAWFNLAASGNSGEAAAKRDLVEKHLSPGALEAARAKSSKLYEEMRETMAADQAPKKPTPPKGKKRTGSK